MMDGDDEFEIIEDFIAKLPSSITQPGILKLEQCFEGQLTAAERRLYDKLLFRFVRTAPMAARARVSRHLAPVPAGPVRTVTALAYDLDFLVAAPLLRASPLLAETDLISIARTRGEEHLSAIAQRAEIGAPVTEVVAARASFRVLRLLARNTNAQWSKAGFQILVRRARAMSRTSSAPEIDVDVRSRRPSVQAAHRRTRTVGSKAPAAT